MTKRQLQRLADLLLDWYEDPRSEATEAISKVRQEVNDAIDG